jgi:hypothetical protein
MIMDRTIATQNKQEGGLNPKLLFIYLSAWRMQKEAAHALAAVHLSAVGRRGGGAVGVIPYNRPLSSRSSLYIIAESFYSSELLKVAGAKRIRGVLECAGV